MTTQPATTSRAPAPGTQTTGASRTRFHDRAEAGRALAAELRKYAGRLDVVVLALPRGGVPVAFEVAQELLAPLDVLIVRKLGLPGHEELAMGAIASGGVRVINEGLLAQLPGAERALTPVIARETRELERREAEYRDGRPAADLRGRTVIVVDDGLATGATMRAAVQALRQRQIAHCVIGVPVAAPDSLKRFRREVDEVVSVLTPADFQAVGQFYDDFAATTDREVGELLARATAKGR
jgi:predicted phosphoribosyltransferase